MVIQFEMKLLVWLKKPFLFLIAGLPSFAMAFPLNFLLVDYSRMPKYLAYAIVLVVQININFLLCRRFVFTPNPDKSLLKQYGEFMSAVSVFRAFDWLVYSFCVETMKFPLVIFGKDCYYLAYQFANVIIFSLAKYFFCRNAIEGPQHRT